MCSIDPHCIDPLGPGPPIKKGLKMTGPHLSFVQVKNKLHKKFK